MNSILSKLNAQLEKYNNGCGKNYVDIPHIGEKRCGEKYKFMLGFREDFKLCQECQAGKNATEKAIEIVKAGIKEIKDKIDLKISWAECHATTQSPSEYFDNLREDVADVLKETLGKVEG